MTDETPDEENVPPPRPMDVYEALAWVQRELSAVAKAKRSGGKSAFSFRGIDDVINALHPILGQAGLMISPVVQSSHIEDLTLRDKTAAMTVTDVMFRVFASDGSRLPKSMCPRMISYGVDPGADKAPGMALSYAYKAAISQLFSLPTDDPAMDNEAHAGWEAQPAQPAPPQWKQDGWDSEEAADAGLEEVKGLLKAMSKDERDPIVEKLIEFGGIMSKERRITTHLTTAGHQHAMQLMTEPFDVTPPAAEQPTEDAGSATDDEEPTPAADPLEERVQAAKASAAKRLAGKTADENPLPEGVDVIPSDHEPTEYHESQESF